MKAPQKLFLIVVVVVVVVGTAPFASHAATIADWKENAILYWNRQALDATRLARNPPPVIALWFGTYHAAMADAVNGIAGRWDPWLVEEKAPLGADLDAAIAGAAYTLLTRIWGQQANPRNFQLAYDEALSQIPDGKAKSEGLAWGISVAERILEEREKSGFKQLLPGGYIPSHETANTTIRSYASFSQPSDGVGQSRIFEGIHTPMDIRVAPHRDIGFGT